MATMGRAMSGNDDGARSQRLKAALRDNLRRRKAQARGREAAEGEPAPEPPADRPGGERR
ncbi:hypothetical protein OPKNFCMD_5339 [Methylobacterium crusticola]|uniref:DUF4169 family protein n=2 Tax=Methylobacterium crusticola TaxID=1697972 RepID=A0ABQ4R4K9_9HYPH|nr:hypothetical protein [Methylobacterium crusticola]GJD52573.1 hypothetical protein OPKNFCMD_5339 [Methylobacterium crusticola]